MKLVTVQVRRPGDEEPLAGGQVVARTTAVALHTYLKALLEVGARLDDGTERGCAFDGPLVFETEAIRTIGGDDEPFPDFTP